MPPDKICKTIHQYNKYPVSAADMDKLVEIAEDYGRIKNYVYQKYGGINSLSKIYPGYTVQNEMTKTNLRTQLGLPSVYFYLAVFEALGDIKNQWTQTKRHISRQINKNENLMPEEKHYLRFVIKQSQCFESVLLGKQFAIDADYKNTYENLYMGLDTNKLDKYLCRQVRKNLKKLHTNKAQGFSITERAYRYGDHGIYISTKEPRRRIFVPLTDSNQYKRQLYIRLMPDMGRITIHIPVETAVKVHDEYHAEVGLAFGMMTMFVSDSGNTYGEEYGKYQFALADYIREWQAVYRRNGIYNPGKKKYEAKKKRMEDALHTYVNKEINRFLKAEKPKIIYLPKLPQTSKAGVNRTYNNAVNLWQKGYVRSRLAQKCREHSIEIVEVYGKDISNECSSCGAKGEKREGSFWCKGCGIQLPDRKNTAINARKRGNALR